MRDIELAVSKDGYTFTDWRKRPLPDWGDYGDPMPTWRRLGCARRFSVQFRITDPVVVNIIAMQAEVE
jgi:hypothetical protein